MYSIVNKSFMLPIFRHKYAEIETKKLITIEIIRDMVSVFIKMVVNLSFYLEQKLGNKI